MREAIEHQKISRKGAEAQREMLCHFDPFDKAQDKLREKSAKRPEAQPKDLYPSHPFGMTGLGPSLGVFAPLREKSPVFYGQQCDEIYLPLTSSTGLGIRCRRENVLPEEFHDQKHF